MRLVVKGADILSCQLCETYTVQRLECRWVYDISHCRIALDKSENGRVDTGTDTGTDTADDLKDQ